MSRASRAGLDLVEDEERPVLVAKPAQPSEEALRRLVYAALALDRLDEHGRGLGTDQRLCGFEISERSVDHAWQHRAEAVLQRGLGRGREAAVGAAVEGLRERQDLVLVGTVGIVGVLAREFDRRLYALGSRVAEEDPVEVRRAAEHLGHLCLKW